MYIYIYIYKIFSESFFLCSLTSSLIKPMKGKTLSPLRHLSHSGTESSLCQFEWAVLKSNPHTATAVKNEIIIASVQGWTSWSVAQLVNMIWGLLEGRRDPLPAVFLENVTNLCCLFRAVTIETLWEGRIKDAHRESHCYSHRVNYFSPELPIHIHLN
jgi:hypothetical protein